MDRTQRSTLLIGTAILPALLVLSGCGAWRTGTPGTIKVSGNIELTQVNIAFKVPGRIVELPLVEGQSVAAGTVLARIDAAQLLRQRERDQAALTGSETLVTQLRTAIE